MKEMAGIYIGNGNSNSIESVDENDVGFGSPHTHKHTERIIIFVDPILWFSLRRTLSNRRRPLRIL